MWITPIHLRQPWRIDLEITNIKKQAAFRLPALKLQIFHSNKKERYDIKNYTRGVLAENQSFAESGENVYLIGGTGRAIAKLHIAAIGSDAKNTDGYTFPAADFAKIRKF